MQANGADMLRLACIYAVGEGIELCATVHDAVLIEATISEINQKISLMRQLMSDASAVLLDGFRLRTDVELYEYPQRFVDPRGTEMWTTVQNILQEMEEVWIWA